MATRRREATTRDAKQRLVQAAFELFEAHGYAATTIDEIAARAGIGRRTFFRYFRSKEDVIFPDHTGLLERVERRLYAWPEEPGLDAACAAVRLVLEHYVDNKQVSLQRYRLVGEVPSLRERETISVAAYQRAFRNRIEPDHRDNRASLQAELMAAAVAAAHNQVLRQWLRGGGRGDPYPKLDDALHLVHDVFRRMPSPGADRERRASWFILAVPDEMPARQVAAELEKLRRTRDAG
jgi:AcrR family transcriptional regulator